jgi:hypothetical protein
VTFRRQLLFVFLTFTGLGLVLSAQRLPEAFAKSLYLVPSRETWVITDWLPGSWRICAEYDGKGFHGCISVKDLRDQAARERREKKS